MGLVINCYLAMSILGMYMVVTKNFTIHTLYCTQQIKSDLWVR